jgi:hypothetical protein
MDRIDFKDKYGLFPHVYIKIKVQDVKAENERVGKINKIKL